MKKLLINKIVEIQITGLKPYGGFGKTDDGSVGMIHISEISADFVRNVADHLVVGEKIPVKVVGVTEKRRVDGTVEPRYSFSVKRLTHEELLEFEAQQRLTLPHSAPRKASARTGFFASLAKKLAKFLVNSCHIDAASL